MGEKDMVEKLMEDYPDVFADVVNTLLFDGEQRVLPEELFDVGLRSQFKADTGREHEQERDVAKYWVRDGEILAMFGLENQTGMDGDMPMRIIAYDGSSYKSQLLKEEDADAGDDTSAMEDSVSGEGLSSQGARCRYPVITLALYFGEQHWGESGKTLHGMFRTSEDLRKYAENYGVHVHEIAHLSEEQLKLFRSDFGILAEYMVHKRLRKPLRMSLNREVKHVDAFLKMLSVFAGDEYVEKLSEDIASKREKGERIMGYDLSKAMVDIGRKEGIQEGMRAGIKEMRQEMNTLITYMFRDNRMEELKRSATDSDLQERLMEEYGLNRDGK